MKKVPIGLMLIALCLAMASPIAASPSELGYMGRIVDDAGRPLAGPVDLRVQFFTTPTGTDAIGDKSYDFREVALTKGLFQLKINVADDLYALFGGGQAIYVQVTDLTNNHTYDRQQYDAVPYALRVPTDDKSIVFDGTGVLRVGRLAKLDLAIGTGSDLVSLRASASATPGTIYTLPDAPVAGSFMTTDASGKLSWGLPAAGSGTITSVTAGTGLTGGAQSGAATLAVDVGTTAGKIVQVATGGKLPALDGSNLTNLSAAGLNGIVANANLPANLARTSDITAAISAVNASNLASGTVPTARIDTGVTTGQIVQVAAGNKLPTLDASNLTSINGAAITSGTVATSRLDTGVTTGKLIVVASGDKLPALDGSNLTNVVAGNIPAASLTGLTTGSVPFANVSGVSQNNANLFWDNSTLRLGVGTNAPSATLEVAYSGGAGTTAARISGSNTSSGQSFWGLNVSPTQAADGASDVIGVRSLPIVSVTFGVTNNLYGILSLPRSTGAGGTITNAYGGFFRVDNTAGTIGTGTGLYVATPSGGGTTTAKYALITEPGAGNVGIGATAPGQLLTVNGTFGILEGGASPTFHTIFQGSDQAGDITYSLPAAAPSTSGQVLSATTGGVMSWISIGTGASQNVGVVTGNLVQVASGNKLPTIDASNLTNVTAANLTGTLAAVDGAAVTNLNAANIATGTLNVARVDTGVTTGKIVQVASGNKLPVIDGSNLTSLTAANLTGALAAVDGAAVTNLDAANIATGTLNAARLDTGVTAGKIVQVASGDKLPAIDGSNLTNVTAANLAGTLGAVNGAAVTNLSAGNIATGTINVARIDTGVTTGKIIQVAASNKLPAIDASNLTNLDAGQLSAGTIPTARIDTGTSTAQIVQVAAGNKLPIIDASNLTALNATQLTTGTVPAARIDTGVTTGQLVQVATGNKLPVIDGSNLTGVQAASVPAANTTGLTLGSIPFAGASGLVENNSKIFWDNTSQHLGIGTSSPVATADITYTGGSATVIERVGGTNTTSGQQLWGLNITPTQTADGAADAVGVRTLPTVNATFGTTSNLYGILSLPRSAGAGGVITNAYGGYFRVDNTAGTVGTSTGVYVGAPTGGGTSTTKYAMITESGAGNVGVGTTSPAQKLTVDGTIGILEGGGSPTYHTIFQGGDQSADVTYTLPTSAASLNGQVLTSTTGGVLSWSTVGTGAAYDVGTSTGNLLQIAAGNKLPVIDGSNLTNLTLTAPGSIGATTPNAGSFTSLTAAVNNSAASGSVSSFNVTPTYSQSGTAGATDLLINRTETSVGSGNQNLIDAQVGSVSRYKISNKGQVTLAYVDSLSSGTAFAEKLTPTYTQTGTAAATDLLINRTETSVGSGAQLLLDAQVGGTSRLNVTNKGLVTVVPATSTASSGTPAALSITATYNQTSTAGATDLLINRTETAVGSGPQRLIDAQVGGVSKFSVSNQGNIATASMPSRREGMFLFDDFLTGGVSATGAFTNAASNWTYTFATATAAPQATTLGQHPGIMRFDATGLTAGNFATFTQGLTSMILDAGSGTIVIEADVDFTLASNVASGFNFYVGLGNNVTAAQYTNGVYWNCTGGTATSSCVGTTSNGGSNSVTSAQTFSYGVTAGSWHRLTITITNGTSALFAYDGTTLGTLSTTMPTVALGPVIKQSVTSTMSAAAPTDVDYFSLVQTFTTQR